MNARNLITAIYVSNEVKEVLQRLEPADLRDDIKQHVFTELLVMEEGFIVDLHTRGKLKHFIVKMLYNTSKWRDRSAFKKQYGFLETSVEDFERTAANEDDIDEDGKLYFSTVVTGSIENNERSQKELVEEILLALKNMYWYKAEVFKLYVRLGTYQKVADATGINLSSIFQTVRQAKNEIKTHIK